MYCTVLVSVQGVESTVDFTVILNTFLVLPFGGTVDLLATTDPDAEQEVETETPIYEKHDKLLHGSVKGKQ